MPRQRLRQYGEPRAVPDGPPDAQRRYWELIDKRRAETLSSKEYDELLELSDKSEELNAERIKALAELAQFRGVSLPEVMDQLGINTPPTYG